MKPKKLGPCDVRSCGRVATWETDDFHKFCVDHCEDWLLDNNPVDDGLYEDDRGDEEFAA